MKKETQKGNHPNMIHNDIPRDQLNGIHFTDELNNMIKVGKESFEDFDPGDVSDTYYTFKELYSYRRFYNALLFNEWAKSNLFQVHKSKLHNDGLKPFNRDDYFIICAMLPTGQISNHYNLKDWDLFQVLETPKALFPYDNHSPGDCLDRMKSLLDSQIF